jgi:uncharacterized protein
MRLFILHSFIFHFCLSAIKIFSQTEKTPDFAVLPNLKNSQVQLRWATSRQDLWKAGIQYGYKIERFLATDYEKASANSVLLNKTPLKPWSQNDERWTALIKENKNIALLNNLLYKSTSSSEMLFALALKSCDLYIDAAKAAGIYLEDNTISENEKYVYKISLWDAPSALKYTPAVITVNTKDKKESAKLKPIKAKFLNRKVLIAIETANTGKDFSGFWIERSSDSINFISVNKAPVVRTTTKYDEKKIESIYTDSLPANNKTFYYRVRGISYFGELSTPSNIISGKGKADFVEYPLVDSASVINNKIARLKFRMPEKFDLNELKGYAIFRSDKKTSGFVAITTTLLTKQTIYFTDEKPQQNNFYKICAVNINNDSSFSLTTNAKLIDDIPPAVPGGLTGKIDTSGVVTLTWNLNTENDFNGYRVYRCNSEKEQPVEITKVILKDAKFTDAVNLQTLTKEVYYTIRSVDKVHNNSNYSAFCKLLRPDKIAPVSPVFKQIIYNDSSIKLSWQPSTSNDVVTCKLVRSDESGNWKLVKEWSAKDSLKKFTDTAISIGNSYKYRLEVYDEAKNYSFENSQSVKFIPAFAPKIKTFTSAVSLEKRNITLNWKYDKTDIYSYTLYKAKGNENLRVYKTVDAQTNNFIDTELYPNNVYRYSIKVTLKSGIESKMSEVLAVEF